MNLVEILKAKGVSDELIAAIQEDMKANSIYTASEENLDIRYGKMKTQKEDAESKLAAMTTDFENLKKSAGDSAELLKQATEKDATIAALQKQLDEALIDGELNVELLAAGAKPEDIDYIKFRIKEKGALEMGDDGKVKGLDDVIAAAKTQLPAHFNGKSQKQVLEFNLPNNPSGDGENEPKSLAEALQLQYETKE